MFPRSARSLTEGLEFNSLIIGLVLGVTLGAVGRCNWSDIPRRIVTWFLVREQEVLLLRADRRVRRGSAFRLSAQ